MARFIFYIDNNAVVGHGVGMETTLINASDYQKAISYVKGHLTACGPETKGSVAAWMVEQVPGVNDRDTAKKLLGKMVNEGQFESETDQDSGITYLAIQF